MPPSQSLENFCLGRAVQCFERVQMPFCHLLKTHPASGIRSPGSGLNATGIFPPSCCVFSFILLFSCILLSVVMVISHIGYRWTERYGVKILLMAALFPSYYNCGSLVERWEIDQDCIQLSFTQRKPTNGPKLVVFFLVSVGLLWLTPGYDPYMQSQPKAFLCQRWKTRWHLLLFHVQNLTRLTGKTLTPHCTWEQHGLPVNYLKYCLPQYQPSWVLQLGGEAGL